MCAIGSFWAAGGCRCPDFEAQGLDEGGVVLVLMVGMVLVLKHRALIRAGSFWHSDGMDCLGRQVEISSMGSEMVVGKSEPRGGGVHTATCTGGPVVAV